MCLLGTWNELQYFIFLLNCRARRLAGVRGQWAPHLVANGEIVRTGDVMSPRKASSASVPKRLVRVANTGIASASSSRMASPKSSKHSKGSASPRTPSSSSSKVIKFSIRWDYIPPTSREECPSLPLEEEPKFGPLPRIYWKAEGGGDKISTRLPSESFVMDDSELISTVPLEGAVDNRTEADALEKGYQKSAIWNGLGRIPKEMKGGKMPFKTMVVCGESGSGKTSFLVNLVKEIFPSYKGELYPQAIWNHSISLAGKQKIQTHKSIQTK